MSNKHIVFEGRISGKKTSKRHANTFYDALCQWHCHHAPQNKLPAVQASGGSATRRLPHWSDCSKPFHNYFLKLKNLYLTRPQLAACYTLFHPFNEDSWHVYRKQSWGGPRRLSQRFANLFSESPLPLNLTRAQTLTTMVNTWVGHRNGPWE